jgi:hypothetical protein
MKNSLVLLVIALIMNVSFVSAKESKLESKFVKTNKEFQAFLTPSSSSVTELENDVVVRVRVYVNSNREIVVMHTNAENNEIANYIKETLNNKKLTSDELAGQSYVFNVNFKA